VQVVSSVPPDYVVDPFWVSQRGERVGPATPRRHRPWSYEFMEAKYWPHRGGRYGKATSQLGYRPNPACTNCHLLPGPYGEDPPSLRVPRRRSAQPDPPITVPSKLPPFKVTLSPVHAGDYSDSRRIRRLSPKTATIVVSVDMALFHICYISVALLANRTATQYGRLLASSCRPSVYL